MITRKMLKYYSGGDINSIDKINLNFKRNKISNVIEENHYIKMKDGSRTRVSTSLINGLNESYILNRFYPSFRIKQDFFTLSAYITIKIKKIKVTINGVELSKERLEKDKFIKF